MQEKLFELRQAPINGRRVRQGRELRGLTQAALSEALGIDQTMVAHIERGTKQPSDELLDALSTELHLPASFFRQGSPPEFPKGSLLFRSKSGIGKRTVSQAHAHAELVFELVLRLSDRASLMPIRLPIESDPIEAARQVRKTLRLQGGPFLHLVRSIERLGVITIPLPELKDCDAFAVWAGPARTYPVIGMVVGKANDRTRMNVAHELGHLVLHRDLLGGTQELETHAYRFAAELLMPTNDIAEDMSSEKLTLFRLASLKKKWQVSMQALARRSRDLDVISDRQYRYLMQQMTINSWRTEEPTFGQEQVESPRLIPKLVEVSFGHSIDLQEIANEFYLTKDFVAGLLSMCSLSPGLSSKKTKAQQPQPIAFVSKRAN
jgi:Zn-dependent peptidase ImmA (M78 family)/DNA-binding XRE family transcriptional regulator